MYQAEGVLGANKTDTVPGPVDLLVPGGRGADVTQIMAQTVGLDDRSCDKCLMEKLRTLRDKDTVTLGEMADS